MKSKPLFYGILAAVSVIVFKLIIILGGFALTNFGFKWSQIISVFMILPFIVLGIRALREQNGGFIGGKEALKAGLLTAVVAILLISVYNYIELDWKWREISKIYYNSDVFLSILKAQDKIKPEQYQEIINGQIEAFSQVTPFKYATFKLVPYLLFSLTTAFMCAVFMKKQPNVHLN